MQGPIDPGLQPQKTPSGLGTYQPDVVPLARIAAIYNNPNNTQIYHIVGLNWLAKHGVNCPPSAPMAQI